MTGEQRTILEQIDGGQTLTWAAHSAGVELTGEAAIAYAALVARLVEAADDGEVTPCLTISFAFLSDDPDDRAAAASICLECPAMVECARFALANDERWGVWGGVDCTTNPGIGPGRARAVLRRIVRGPTPSPGAPSSSLEKSGRHEPGGVQALPASPSSPCPPCPDSLERPCP